MFMEILPCASVTSFPRLTYGWKLSNNLASPSAEYSFLNDSDISTNSPLKLPTAHIRDQYRHAARGNASRILLEWVE